MPEIDVHIEKLNAATRAGFTGEAAISYAELIPGSTVEEVKEGAAKLVSVVAAINASRRPANGNFDGEANESQAARDLKDVIAEELDR